jgi:hypothetical protein
MLTDQQTGTLDDHSLLDNFKTNAELYVANRPKWIGAQEGAAQKQAMS